MQEDDSAIIGYVIRTLIYVTDLPRQVPNAAFGMGNALNVKCGTVPRRSVSYWQSN